MATALPDFFADDQYAELRQMGLLWWVSSRGIVVCKDPQTGLMATGRSLRLAFESLRRKLRRHVH